MDEKEAAKRLFEDWDNSYPSVRQHIEQWRVNVAHAEGYSGVRLLKQQDMAIAYFPLNSAPNVNAMNEAQRLRRRLRAVLFADPPVPEATPASDESDDRDAAETTTRVLLWECDEGRLSYAKACGDAFDIGSDYGSGFIHFYVDPNGGGWQPQQVQASPQATTAEDATHDPMTGAAWDGEFILRYVKNDGTLTDNRADPDVAMQWLPAVKRELLTGKQVRFIPSTAEDIWDADGVRIASLVPLGSLKAMFPKLAQMDDAALSSIVQARPQNVRDLLPKGRKDLVGPTTDDTLVFVVTEYHKQGAEYPKGAHLIAAGGEVLLHRDEWWDAEHGEPLDICLTQMAQLYKDGNPYYVGCMEQLGPGNELLAYCFGAVLEHLDRLSSRKTYLPFTSNLTPEQLQSPTATVLYTVPGATPTYEELPELPAAIEQTIQFVRDQMKDEVNMQDPIGGQNPPSVQSDVHARTIIEQVNQTLSELKQNSERGIRRGYRIIAQLVRAFYTIPQQIRSQGEDGAYKLYSYMGADLGDTRDVNINKSSFTGLNPSAKAALAQSLFMIRDAQGQGIFSLEDLKHVITGNVGGLLGVQDNPQMERVKRQITRWQQGPPEGWTPPQPVDPATGQPTPPPPDPLWNALPVDIEPAVAKTRAYELGRAMSSVKFTRWSPEWQQGLVAEYQKMAQAANIASIPALQQQIQGLQQQVSQGQQKMQAAEARPKIALSVKGTDLDSAQTAAVLSEAGLNVPPSAPAPQSGDIALQQVGELHQGVTEAIGHLQSQIHAAKEQAAKPEPEKAPGPLPLTIVNPSRETEAAIEQLAQHVGAATADHAQQLASHGADLEAVKQLATNTALHVQQNPKAIKATAFERDKHGKAVALVHSHADGSQSRVPILRKGGKIVGLQPA